jgi:hypothetical protein
MNNIIKFILLFCCLTQNIYAIQIEKTLSLAMPQYRYSINYPAQWSYQDKGEGVVIFKGKTLDGSHLISANIQTIATKKFGGHYVDVKALMDDFWDQVPKHMEKVKFIERKPIELVESDGRSFQGEQTTLTFIENGVTMKQWQVMLITQDGMIFQNYAFRTTADEFDKNFAVANTMYHSWMID